MSKNKSNSGVVGGIIGAIVLISIVPPAVWVTLLVLGGVGFVLFRFVRQDQNDSNLAARQNPDETTSWVSLQTKEAVRTSVSYRIPAPPSNLPSDARWIPAGETVEIAGYVIPGGMLYLGTRLFGKWGQADPSLVNPHLSVGRPGNSAERLMGYWPSYSEISPEARGSYLSWLSGGRADPDADVGNLFLFFYGLERRILVDGDKSDIGEREKLAIRNEVERLLNIYGGNSPSVSRYLSGFIQLLGSGEFGEKLYLQPVPPLGATYELPFYLRLALGQAAVDGVPVPNHIALAWALADPIISKRTPVTRCPQEFAKLFFFKYSQYHGEGIKLSVNKTKLSFNYSPASSALRGLDISSMSFGSVPDVAAVMGPQKKLQKIVDECAEELGAYSRYIGRNADKQNSIDGLLLLPVSLWPDRARATMAELKEKAVVDTLIVTIDDLAKKFGATEGLSRDKLTALAIALESEQIGIEPDILSHQYSVKSEDSLLIYHLKQKAPIKRNTPEYQTAVVTLQLGAAVASADGNIHEKEVVHLNDQLTKWEHLSAYHQARLRAHLTLMLQRPMPIASLKKRLTVIDPRDRQAIIHFVSHLALADGTVTPDEISFLEKVYKVFEVDVSELYSFLHSGAAPMSSTANSDSVKKSTKLSLDRAKINSLRIDTQNVSSLLSGIFTEKMDEPVEPHEQITESSESILGLDDAHGAFLRMLFGKTTWSRQEVIDIAADLDIMVDGAIEAINEAAFEKHNEPAIEGDDPLEVNMSIREKVLV